MQEISDFFELYKQSAWSKDSSTMVNLYDDQVVIFDMWDQGFMLNLPEWKNMIVDWLGSLGEEKVKVDFEMIKINQSGNVGFASALIGFQAIASDGAVLRSMKNRITLGFSKLEDGWKVMHQHTSAPISSDGLTGI